jgi:hypothetical protein
VLQFVLVLLPQAAGLRTDYPRPRPLRRPLCRFCIAIRLAVWFTIESVAVGRCEKTLTRMHTTRQQFVFKINLLVSALCTAISDDTRKRPCSLGLI